MKNFEADKTSIKALLSKGLKYRIPGYQRPYSWEKDYIDNFWVYLNDESDNYFLGTIVLNNEFLDDEGVKDIVDGQQRFITVTLLYAVIRDFFQTLKDSTKADAIHGDYIAFKNADGDDSGYKLSVGDSLKDFFEKNIQKKISRDISEIKGKNKEEKRVIENYKFFQKEIEKMIQNETHDSKIQILQNLRDKLSNLDIVYIEVCSEDDAYTFFETINATGMKLSTADILKNLIFKKSGLNREDIESGWNYILENLKNLEDDFDITRFIRHYWLSKHTKVSDRKLYHSIKKSIDKDKEYPSYDIFLKELKENSDLYHQILYPNSEYLDTLGKSIARNLKNIRGLKVYQPNPLILSLLRKIQKNKKFQVAISYKLLDIIERFTFIYNTVTRSPSKIEKIYSDYAIKIEKTDNINLFEKEVQSCIDKMKSELPKKEEFVANFVEIKYKNNSDVRRLIVYIYNKINNNGDNEIQVDHVNIEHIFPQNPSGDYTKEQIKETEPFINDLGNLIILKPTINRQAGNKSIKEKLEKYDKTVIMMNHSLIEKIQKKSYQWTKSDILERNLELAEVAWNIFSF